MLSILPHLVIFIEIQSVSNKTHAGELHEI